MAEFKFESFPLTLEIEALGCVRQDSFNRLKCRYDLKFSSESIWSGDDFFPSPLHSEDGKEAAEALLGFFFHEEANCERIEALCSCPSDYIEADLLIELEAWEVSA